jgi:uncharacterized protein
MTSFTLITRPGVDPHSAPRKPPLPPADYRRIEEQGLVIDRNLSVPLRDGTRIYIDLYRPASRLSDALPLLLGWSPYGKHTLTNQVFWPASGVDPNWLSTLTAFEAPDPVYWGRHGYAVAFADPRGAWLSEGDFHHNGAVEGEDCYDLIQWLAVQSWSNGKVGMTGVSYLAAIQYLVAPLKPPALAAINPWEGFSDWYREFAYHGGIPETGFMPRASDNIRFSLGRTEDTLANVRAHPLWDGYWASKELELEAIEIPAYVVASWADQGLHTRGTLEAFKRMRSREKWLEVHGQKKWAHYYRPESRARQREFFDHFLKERGTLVPAWPRVRLEVRKRAGVAAERRAERWPLTETRYVPLWINSVAGTLEDNPSAVPASCQYDAREGRAIFDFVFPQTAELTGHAKLRLWVEAEGSEDMDLFVALQKLDVQGTVAGMTFYAFYENGPVALGWLRASHRDLDAARSTAWQPVHPHDAENPLHPEERVPLDIEIWPSSTRFEAGETLRLLVQGHDVYSESLPNLPFARHEETRNRGIHRLWSGEKYDSHLLVPWIGEQ